MDNHVKMLSASIEDISEYEPPKFQQRYQYDKTTHTMMTQSEITILSDQTTHTSLVKEFTEQSLGVKLPIKPSKMTKEEVRFIVRMVISEMMELCTTVSPTVKDALDLFDDCIKTTDKPKPFHPETKTDTEIMAEQYDSFVDAWYYMLNTAVKKGANLDRIFQVVHGANMAKKFPDGTFHRREDGKVIKPEGWKEPDVVGEIQKQLEGQ
jgi:predicted HAD superfamily Cof-like phosphohydrolase